MSMRVIAREIQLADNLSKAFDLTGDSTHVYIDALRQAGDTGTGFIDTVNAQVAALKNYQDALGDTPALADTHAAGLATHATTAGSALGDAFRVAVGNTNQIGDQASSVNDWAMKLINVKGQYGEIDKLLSQGVISQKEYNQAQSAQTSIFHNNAAIQRDILKIQTDQAPLMAELTKNERDYLDQLAKQPAEQQLATLGYMDSAESARALTLQQLALSAATGELGSKGEATAQSMIAAAAEADPVLQAMLKDMGLITVGADGKITVDFGDVDAANTPMGELIDHLDTLIGLIADTLHIRMEDSEVTTARDHTYQLNAALAEAGRDHHATVTVDHVDNFFSSGGGSQGGHAQLGGVLSYARGGVIAELAEAGPELLHFAGGGTAWAMNRGLYQVPNNTYVTPANAAKPGPPAMTFHNVTINVYPQQGASVMAEIQEWAVGASRG